MNEEKELPVPDGFEWDDRKAARNLRVHSVSFTQATQVFNDPWAILRFDREVEGEERFHLTGTVAGLTLLVVVHTYRGRNEEPTIRIISARKATMGERKDYQKTLSSAASQ